jgi:hypothetical protein
MLLLLFNWLYQIFILFSFGLYFNSLFRPKGQKLIKVLTWSFILGYVSITFFATIVSLVGPLNEWLNIVFSISAIILLVINRKFISEIISQIRNIKIAWWEASLFVICFIYAFLECRDWGDSHDEYLYYQQTVKWLNEYGSVTGLANLHIRLGHNSSWHILAAIFNFPTVREAYLNEINGLLFVLLSLYCIGRIKKLTTGEFTIANCMAGLTIPFTLLVFSAQLSDPTPDFSNAAFLWVLCIEIFDYLMSSKAESDSNTLIKFCILALYIFTIKLSLITLFIIPIAIVCYWFWQRSYKNIISTIAICMIIITPWLGRNIIQTGYLIFPVSSVDVFDVAWKIPKKTVLDTPKNYLFSVEDEKNFIEFCGFGYFEVPAEEFIKYPFCQKISLWYEIIVNKQNLWMLIVFALSLVFIPYINHKIKIRPFFSILLLLFLISSFLIWIKHAPSFRFAYGFIGIAIMLLGGFILLKLLTMYSRMALILIISINFFVVSIVSITSGTQRNIFKGNFIRPVQSVDPEYEEYCVDSDPLKVIRIPNDWDGRCGLIDLPCAQRLNPYLKFRSQKISDGFITGKTPTLYSKCNK